MPLHWAEFVGSAIGLPSHSGDRTPSVALNVDTVSLGHTPSVGTAKTPCGFACRRRAYEDAAVFTWDLHSRPPVAVCLRILSVVVTHGSYEHS